MSRLPRHLLVTAAAVVLTACGRGPTPAAQHEPIAVKQFIVSDRAHISDRDPAGPTGMILAEEVALRLRELGWTAEAIPAGRSVSGRMLVVGRVTRVDEGFPDLRGWFGIGVDIAAGATFGAEGEVRRQDGTTVARFSEEKRSASGLDKCIIRVACEIAEMIDTGRYRGGTPGAPGALVPAHEETLDPDAQPMSHPAP